MKKGKMVVITSVLSFLATIASAVKFFKLKAILPIFLFFLNPMAEVLIGSNFETYIENEYPQYLHFFNDEVKTTDPVKKRPSYSSLNRTYNVSSNSAFSFKTKKGESSFNFISNKNTFNGTNNNKISFNNRSIASKGFFSNDNLSNEADVRLGASLPFCHNKEMYRIRVVNINNSTLSYQFNNFKSDDYKCL